MVSIWRSTSWMRTLLNWQLVDAHLFDVAFAGEDGLDLEPGLRIDERLVGASVFDALEGDDTSDKLVSPRRTGIRAWLPRVGSNQHRRFSPVWQTTQSNPSD